MMRMMNLSGRLERMKLTMFVTKRVLTQESSREYVLQDSHRSCENGSLCYSMLNTRITAM